MEDEYCSPCLSRTGRKVLASHAVNGEAFCQGCFDGKVPGSRKAVSYKQKGVDGAEVLRLCQTMPIKHAAARLGVHPSTVQYYLKKARRERERRSGHTTCPQLEGA